MDFSQHGQSVLFGLFLPFGHVHKPLPQVPPLQPFAEILQQKNKCSRMHRLLVGILNNFYECTFHSQARSLQYDV